MSDKLFISTRKGLFTVCRNTGHWEIAAVDFHKYLPHPKIHPLLPSELTPKPKPKKPPIPCQSNAPVL